MRTLYILGVCTALLLACKTHFKTGKVDFTVNDSKQDLHLGKKLTVSICAPCHYDPATRKLTGIQMHDLPKMAGTVYSRNITQDKQKGIADYTDGELAYLMRTGIARDGRLMSYMQRPNMSDGDLRAIIAFLHSTDTLVTPSPVEPPETHYTAMGKFGINHFPGPLPYPTGPIAKPDTNDQVNYGRYLVDNLSCYHCHSASFLKVDEINPERSKRYMGGGNKLKTSNGKTIVSPNLTFHKTGLMVWSLPEFKRAVKEGICRNDALLRPPMPKYTELSSNDIASIYAYLRTIPKINHKAKRKID